MDATRLKTLDELAIFHQTDRATAFTRTHGKPHGYAPHYDRAFSHLRNEAISLLEIGVGGGEGIRMWLDYFPRARIYGIDNVSYTNEWNTPEEPTGRYHFVCGNQASGAFWKSVRFEPFNIIIDDGSHINVDVITTFLYLWSELVPGGLYCIEDLGCAYGPGSVFIKGNLPSQNEFLKAKIDEMHQGLSDIESMSFSRELVIIKKRL
jgi:hypothetical protein